jgi:hypothetical protein
MFSVGSDFFLHEFYGSAIGRVIINYILALATEGALPIGWDNVHQLGG